MKDLTVGEIVKNSCEALFSHYRQGYLYYRVIVAIPGTSREIPFVFPIEVKDLGTATVSLKEKPITLMRYIRKAVDDGSFVRAGLGG